MKTLIAKPVIKDQYWVITDGDKKVGNVLANDIGFNVKLNGTSTYYTNTNDIKRKEKIVFQTLKTNKSQAQIPFAIYPTTSKVFNSIFDIKKRIHLYTKTLKSKCYYAAGYYVINQNKENEIVFCPKYIFIQRYQYLGPFKTENEAKSMINSL